MFSTITTAGKQAVTTGRRCGSTSSPEVEVEAENVLSRWLELSLKRRSRPPHDENINRICTFLVKAYS